jgi:lysophospholipase L1-like esterase
MRARGVTVLISQTPISEDYYQRHGPALEALHNQLTQAFPGALIARPPREYTFPSSMIFDTDYHLNQEGRQRRSEMLAQDILQHIPGGCGGSISAN